LVSKCKTKEWPEGLAYLVVRELNKRYRPRDIVSRVEMRQKLNQVKMKKGSDPAVLFETLAAIEDQFDGFGMIDEADLIAIVLDVAPDDFQAVLTAEQRIRGKELTLYDLEVVMTQHYRQTNRGRSTRRDEGGEVLLSAVNITCYSCGKSGHMANKCPNREKGVKHDSNQGKRTEKKCLNCNIKGHLAKDCWFKDANKDKRPAGFKVKISSKNNEQAAAAVDTNNNDTRQEYLLGVLDKDDVINDPNLWIADTAATIHMTPYRTGVTNLRKINNAGTITMGNGTQEEITEVGDVLGIVHQGDEGKRVRLQDITALKNG